MIYTPFACVDMILREHRNGTLTNPQTCTKIEFRGYEISVAMDSSLCFGRDLRRTDIRVFKDDKDVSDQFLDTDCNMIYGSGEELFRVMERIRNLTN